METTDHRKKTARRWLHKYVWAECSASNFTWYLYQICKIDVRLWTESCPLCFFMPLGVHQIVPHGSPDRCVLGFLWCVRCHPWENLEGSCDWWSSNCFHVTPAYAPAGAWCPGQVLGLLTVTGCLSGLPTWLLFWASCRHWQCTLLA